MQKSPQVLQSHAHSQAYHKNEILHDYFKLFMRECFDREKKSAGVQIDIRVIEDSDLTEMLRTFISFARASSADTMSPADSAQNRLEGLMQNVKPKLFEKFKANLALDDGDRNARFDKKSFLLHFSDHSSKKIIVSTSMIKCIRFGEQKDGSSNSTMMKEHAEKIFAF